MRNLVRAKILRVPASKVTGAARVIGCGRSVRLVVESGAGEKIWDDYLRWWVGPRRHTFIWRARVRHVEPTTETAFSLGKGDILSLEHTDPVLNAKMPLVNNAIDEIGFTPYHWKLFVLNGFGYAIDSLILSIQSIIAGQAALEFHPGFKNGLTIAAYVDMLTGASFWAISADIIGRRFAFHTSLVICSVFAIVAGSAPNWIVLGLFLCLRNDTTNRRQSWNQSDHPWQRTLDSD